MAVSPLAPQWLHFPENINALRQIEWASGVSREAGGELSIQGLPVSALAAEIGTPLFVLDGPAGVEPVTGVDVATIAEAVDAVRAPGDPEAGWRP